jgi:hypothetical protein
MSDDYKEEPRPKKQTKKSLPKAKNITVPKPKASPIPKPISATRS